MTAASARCLSDELLLAFASGELEQQALASADAHLDTCDGCRDVVAELAHGAGGGGALARGAEVGRYLVTGVLGRGAMGVVYSAYDPELDRRVALKLVRPEIAAARSAHLLREAQAMARLSHPNIVAVFDAGTRGTTVFLAMEHVEGESLTEWLRRQPRSWRQVRDVFAQAARGLAAAHQSGLIHRDFKPDNVLVDRDDGVKVGDFGLALGDGGASAPEAVSDPSATKIIAGTPAYMAPEQLRGERADAASDQFSLCVALYEALAGDRPHQADPRASLEELATAAVGPAPGLPARSGPRWLRAAVARGLRSDPGERHESLEALAAALEKRPTRRSLWVLAAAAPAVMLGLGALAAGGSTPEAPCTSASSQAATLWATATADRVRARLTRPDAPEFVGPALAAFESGIEQWRARWISTHTGVCQATRVEGTQSERLLDVRMHCLDRSLRRATAVVTALDDADRATAFGALQRVDALLAELPVSASCATRQDLTLQQPPSAAAAARLPELEDRLATVRALLALGDHARAQSLGVEVLAEAQGLGHPPILAEVALVAASVARRLDDDDKAIALAEEAMLLAQASHTDRVAAEALIALVGLEARAGRFARADAHQALAGAVIERLDSPADLSAALASIRGVMAFNRADLASARRHLEAAAALLGDDAPDLSRARLETGLGNIDRVEGNLERALERHRAALAINRRALGEKHPAVARNLHNIAGVERLLARPDAAREAYERALAIKRAAFGSDHSEVALTRNSLAVLALDSGDLVSARQHLEAARPTMERGDHAELVGVLRNLGLLAEKEGNRVEARRQWERALEVARRMLVARDPRIAELQADLERVVATRPSAPRPRPATPPAATKTPESPVKTTTEDDEPAGSYMPGQVWD